VDSVTLNLGDIMRGTEALIRFKLSGSKLVSQDEADNRAATCATCKFNSQHKSNCGGICDELKRLVVRIVGASLTSNDASLGSCAVCKCALKAKVFLPKSLLQAVDTPEIAQNYPDHCWMK
jgi:hypothetical protein